MAKTPINDPNHSRASKPYAAETEKKSKVLPIIIGVIVLAILAYFLLSMMPSNEEVNTADPVAGTRLEEAETAPDVAVVDSGEPEDGTAPAVTPEIESVPETDAAEVSAAPADVTEESITVEIAEPDETAAPVEGTKTTTVPLQTPENAPAN